MIEIDGSYGEGGGQIVRTACALSVVTGKPCRIFHIRSARTRPGLQRQHLLGIRALAELCGAVVSGDQLGSGELVFRPCRIVPHDLDIRIDTAGSITLLLQSLIPATLAARTPMTLTFHGGATDTALSPTLDYFRHIFLWFLRRMGISLEMAVDRRGYYPKGGAQAGVEIRPRPLQVMRAAQRGRLKEVSLVSSSANSLKVRKVAERQIEGALAVLAPLSLPLTSKIEYAPSFSPGCALCIVAEFEGAAIGADAIGAIGKRAERVGEEAAQAFMKELRSAACLDRHMADQILPYMALAGDGGYVTVSEITNHCRTNMWVIEKFLDGRFQLEESLIRWVS